MPDVIDRSDTHRWALSVAAELARRVAMNPRDLDGDGGRFIRSVVEDGAHAEEVARALGSAQ
jgi:hypothetical protein